MVGEQGLKREFFVMKSSKKWIEVVHTASWIFKKLTSVLPNGKIRICKSNEEKDVEGTNRNLRVLPLGTYGVLKGSKNKIKKNLQKENN